jgi:argininosuccinate lyase
MTTKILQDSRGQGEGARLKEGPAPELMQAAFRLELADAPVLWRGLSLADLAHIIMLRETGIAPATASARLLRLLLELHALPVEHFSFNPALEDVYSNREAWLRKRDEEAAGWMGAGRPRREPATIAYRIAVRDRLLLLVEEQVALCRALLATSEAHAATLMPDYTYLQHAQPTSLGHYLLSFVYPLVRDLERVRACYERTNQSPAGIGSINGSRLPVDRRRLAQLLGFDDVIMNTRDAMWQVDNPVELASVGMMTLLHIDRLAEDLQIWNTAEFSLVELADRHARISLIMPQKKNPYSLAFIRGMTGNLMGKLTSLAAVGKTPSAQMDNRIFVIGEAPRMLDQVNDALRLMAGVVKGLTFNAPLMAERAAEGYAQATDLAEVIMQKAGLNYRTAHRIVGLAIRLAIDSGEEEGTIPSAVLDEAARQVLGRPLGLTGRDLESLADPADLVATRQCLGGAAVEPVHAMLEECRKLVDDAESWRRNASRFLDRSEKDLLEHASVLAATA